MAKRPRKSSVLAGVSLATLIAFLALGPPYIELFRTNDAKPTGIVISIKRDNQVQSESSRTGGLPPSEREPMKGARAVEADPAATREDKHPGRPRSGGKLVVRFGGLVPEHIRSIVSEAVAPCSTAHDATLLVELEQLTGFVHVSLTDGAGGRMAFSPRWINPTSLDSLRQTIAEALHAVDE